MSAALDRVDPFPGGRYTLEVSSPGVERPLRRPRDFARAVGETVTVRTRSGGEGERRFTGRLTSADEEGFVLDDVSPSVPADAASGRDTTGCRFSYEEIERARTVFEWGASAPGSRPGRPTRARGAARAAEGRAQSRGARGGKVAAP
jgi:ribosome maturation factor RimP